MKITEEMKKQWQTLIPVEYRVDLNPSLIQSQDLSRYDVGEVFKAHGCKCDLFNEAREFLIDLAHKGEINEEDEKIIQQFNDDLEQLEYSAQEAWHFEANSNYHNWWMDMPGCTCPKMDNNERLGIQSAGRIYSGDCPWHGQFSRKNKTEN